MIYDKEHLQKFVSILPELTKNEVYFISLSARNKYLTEEERLFYHLGRTEMFGRKLVRNKEDYIKKIERLFDSLPSYKTKNGKNMPEKAMVCYANINPSDGVKAYLEFNSYINEILIKDLESNGKFQHNNFKKLDTIIMNFYQKSRSRKNFIDVDCDTKDKDIVRALVSQFLLNKLKFHIIETKSGYHILIERNSIKYNYMIDINNANQQQISIHKEGEIVLNKNEMIPIPGTLQAGFKVRFIDEV